MKELNLEPTDAEIEEFKNEFDEDRSGDLSLDEFKDICCSMRSLNNPSLTEQVGTIMYMAPEVVKKDPYCTRVIAGQLVLSPMLSWLGNFLSESEM